MAFTKKTVRDIDVDGKRVLVRVDFNVPIKDGVVGDTTRIKAALPTINYLVEHNARVILMSHLGRPEGTGFQPELSLEPVAKKLAELSGLDVAFVADTYGEKAAEAVAAVEPGKVLVLENVRFDKREKKNDPEIAKKLASYGDVFVLDAFGTAHRAQGSVVGPAAYLPAVAGFLLEKEVDTLTGIFAEPERPFVAIVGGSKVSSKIGVLDHLIDSADTLIIGGGMAYTFFLAQGLSVGQSLKEEDWVERAGEMLKKAEAGKYALGAFNTNNLEWTLAILQAAEEAKSPLILQCTAGAAKWMGGFKVCADMVKAAVEATGVTVPVALHLDHGSYEDCFKCIEAGFTSIMYDGSHEETFQLNLDRTKELVELAHSKGMSIEAEVGGIGGTEDGVTSNGELADPAECKQIADLGVDFLACGIGNIHGVYPADWAGLSFERLGEIKAQTGDLPLVLHGGTGIPEDQIKKAISLGISKININTECQLVFAEATRKYIEAGKDQQGKGFDPRKLLKPGRDNIVARTKELMEEFGSVNKA